MLSLLYVWRCEAELDAANVEYNVALYHLQQMKLSGALVMAEHLPFTNLAFHLSSQKHPEQITAF